MRYLLVIVLLASTGCQSYNPALLTKAEEHVASALAKTEKLEQYIRERMTESTEKQRILHMLTEIKYDLQLAVKFLSQFLLEVKQSAVLPQGVKDELVKLIGVSLRAATESMIKREIDD